MRTLKIIPQAFNVPRSASSGVYHRARELLAHEHQLDILTDGLAEPPGLAAWVFGACGGSSRPSLRDAAYEEIASAVHAAREPGHRDSVRFPRTIATQECVNLGGSHR